MMKKEQKFSRSPSKLIIIFSFITIFVLILGIRYYSNQKDEIRKEVYSNLSVIAELKMNQIINWRNERMGDANVLFDNRLMIFNIKKWFDFPENGDFKNIVTSQLSVYTEYYRYNNIILFDTNGIIKYNTGIHLQKLSQITYSNFRETIINKKPLFSDVYYCDICDELHLDVVIPLLDEKNVFGGVIYRINPQEFLFPLIQSWPTLSKSAETLLVTKEGNEVVFLNELRHKKNTALKLRYKIDSSNFNIPAVQAVMGKEGLVEGIDYREVSVLSDIRKIPNSPWYLIAKIDLDEVYEPVREKTFNISLLTGLILLSIGIGFIWIWSNQNKVLQIQRIKDEQLRQALIKHFDYIVKYANDIFIMFDMNLSIIDANERAFKVYGYSREEFIGLNIKNLRKPETIPDLIKRVKAVDEKGEALYEAVHLRKDGSAFPIEVSLRLVEIENVRFYQAIIRDISERRQAEEKLKAEKEFTESALNTQLDTFFVFNPLTGKAIRWNKVFEEVSGYSSEEIAKLKAPDSFYSQEDLEKASYAIEQILKNGYGTIELDFICKDGKTIPFEYSTSVMYNESGQPENFISIGRNISERRQAEIQIRESEIKFRSLFENAILGIYRTSLDGKLLECNPALINMLGYSSFEELAEKNIVNGYAPGFFRSDFMKRIEIEKEVKGYESAWQKKDGTSIFVRENSKIVADKNGNFLFYEGTVEDITERKLAEDALRLKNLVFDSSISANSITDINGVITEVNDAFLRVWGYSDKSEVIGNHLIKFLENPEEVSMIISNLNNTGEWQGNFIARKKDGSTFIAHSLATIVKDEKGNAKGYQSTAYDITEQKNAEEKIRLSEEKFSKIFRSSPYAIILTHPLDGKIVDINSGFSNITGYQYPEVLGKSTIDLKIWINDDDRDYVISELSKGNKVFGREFGFRKRSGEKAIGLYSAEIVTINNENLILSSFTDITELKNVEEQIRNLVKRYHIILANQYYGTIVISKDNKVEFVNEKFCKQFDLIENPSELMGISDKEMIAKIINSYSNPEYALTLIKKFVNCGKPELDYEISLKNGRIFLVDYIPIIIDGKNTGRLWQHRDITDRKKLEEELKKSYELLDGMGDIGKIGGWEFDSAALKGTWTKQVALIHDLNPDEQVNIENAVKYYIGESKIKIENALKNAIEKGTPYDLELEMLTAKGNHKWVRTIGLVDKVNDKVVRVHGSFQDITELKKAEDALRESENKFRNLFESMSEGVALHELVYDKNGKAIDYKIIDINPAYEKHTGVLNEKAKNKLASDLYGIKTFPPYFDIYTKVALTGIPDYFESYFQPLKKYFEVSVFSPKKNFFATVFSDVTERKMADIALRESESKLREAQEMAKLGYWEWNVKTGDVSWSEEVYKIFHLDPKKFTPQIDSILAFSPWPEYHNRGKEIYDDIIKGNKSGSYEQKFLRPDNSIAYYYSSYQGKFDEKEELISIVGTVMDITDRKKTEEEIKKLNTELEKRVLERTIQLEQSNKELESFSYSVSHDLRSPLRSIDGFSLALFEDYNGNLDEKGKEYIGRIRNATERMDELIDSMLKLSRVTRFEIFYNKVDLSALTKEIADKLKSSDIVRDAEFVIKENIIAEGDKYLVSILLENLLNNAWKFTSKKEKTVIELGTFKKDKEVVYFIRDNGSGFDMKYYDKLFGAFQRLHSKKEFPGTGIGLATAQRIVHRHNGKIWAESEIGKGTTFFFTLK